MKRGVIKLNSNFNSTLIGNSCGTITISVYKDSVSNYPFFFINTDNKEELSNIIDVLEDTLKCY